MSNTIKIKRSNTQNAIPSLAYGELGLRVNTGGDGARLYYGNASGSATDAKTLMPVATLTDTGLASFATGDFAITGAGAVTVKLLGIDNDQLAGSIANAKLENSSVTVGSTAISLGNAATSLAGMVNIDCTTSGTKTIYGSAGANNVNIGGTATTVVIPGDLQVNGNTVTTNVGTLQVEDANISVAYDNNAGDTIDFGLYGTYRTSGENFNSYSGIFRDTSATGKDSHTGVWTVYDKLTINPGATVDTDNASSDYELGDFSANIVNSDIDCGTFS